MLFDLHFSTLTYALFLLTAGTFLYQYVLQRKSSLSHLPHHKFEKNDTPQSYIQNSAELLHSGYLKVGYLLHMIG